MEDGAVSMAETIEAFKKIDDQEDKGIKLSNIICLLFKKKK